MAELTVARFPDAGALLERAGGYLAAREAEHNLLLGIAGRLVTQPNLYGEETPYLAAVEQAGDVVAVAIRTPPFGVLLSEIAEPAALDVVTADLRDEYRSLPGVTGPPEAARRFAELWAAATGCEVRRGFALRVFAISEVVPPQDVSGRMRKAGQSDRELLIEWLGAFTSETNAPSLPAARAADDLLSRGGDLGAYLWEDGAQPVSLAAGGSPTPNGARIGPVYTPPESRGRGYASALTAALTQALLDGGRRFCFLFTDLANPTSNRIYQRIGYRAVTDVDEYRFA
jgi:hypothetical protein